MSDYMNSWVSKNGTRRKLTSGQRLFSRHDTVSQLFFVYSGMVNLVRFSQRGNKLVLSRAGAGKFLAEASVFSQTYHCDGECSQHAELGVIDRALFRQHLLSDQTFSAAWFGYLASELQSTRSRLEIVSHRKIADRLDNWLEFNGHCLPDKGNWLWLAGELAVSPEALYRELAKRR